MQKKSTFSEVINIAYNLRYLLTNVCVLGSEHIVWAIKSISEQLFLQCIPVFWTQVHEYESSSRRHCGGNMYEVSEAHVFPSLSHELSGSIILSLCLCVSLSHTAADFTFYFRKVDLVSQRSVSLRYYKLHQSDEELLQYHSLWTQKGCRLHLNIKTRIHYLWREK